MTILVDDVTLATADLEGWLAAWRADYAPAARARGLELLGIWTGGASDPEHSTVLVQWHAPSMGVFWASRLAAEKDPGVASFWRATDAIALARERRVLVPVEPT